MRISDWSSDVCSSDLLILQFLKRRIVEGQPLGLENDVAVPSQAQPAQIFQNGRDIFGPAACSIYVFYAKTERSEEHTSELQSLMRISYAVFCLKKKNNDNK